MQVGPHEQKKQAGLPAGLRRLCAALAIALLCVLVPAIRGPLSPEGPCAKPAEVAGDVRERAGWCILPLQPRPGIERKQSDGCVTAVRESIEDVRESELSDGERLEPVPIFPLDGGVSDLTGFQARAHGEVTDSFGVPERNWQGASSPTRFVERRSPRFDREKKAAVQRRFAYPHLRGFGRSSAVLGYLPAVQRAAAEWKLRPSLLLAIMQAESRGNPFSTSASNAVGLMQLLPNTAVKEVDSYLEKTRRKSMRGANLLTPEVNIRYGACYLHLLENRYFRAVKNRTSREICIIAAYNAGPGRFLRHFGTDPAAAVSRINSLAPADLFSEVVGNIRRVETRQYLGKVFSLMETYRGLGY